VGRVTPLALYGQARALVGFDLALSRALLRLRAPESGTICDPLVDAAVIRNENDAAAARSAGFQTAVVIGAPEEILSGSDFERYALLDSRFAYLGSDDVLAVEPRTRRLRTLYRRQSEHNSFLVTERCNHWCLMCSQPPKDQDDSWILDEIAACLPLLDPATRYLGFTGGEPLLEWRRFIALLGRTRDILPNTEIHVLSNGRAFASREIVSSWADLRHQRLCVGIPLYAAVDSIHDYVVQAQGAFAETLLGIMRLKDKGQRIEVRVVLHRVTAERLRHTCEWLARNLPFVDHVALMGLENTGFALANQDLLWIDPVDYQADLAEGVAILTTAGVHVSVYNLPLCILDRSLWPFAVQSISDWKNAYAPECDGCSARPRCSGFFSTGRQRRSRGIHPLDAAAA
jgi:His-Xaa-Ser system radical SAM maturase HxsC